MIGTRNGPHRLLWGWLTFSAGVDGLALSKDGAWLYYAAMNHDGLFRVPTAALRDATLPDEAIAARIERIGDKPLSDGISIGAAGEVFITDVEHGAVSVVDASGALQTLARSPDVVGSDAVIPEADGSLLLVDSAIPAYIQQSMTPPPKAALDQAGPYHIYRIQR